MAFIHGIEPGLVPSISPQPVEPTEGSACTDPRCSFCQAILVDKGLKFSMVVDYAEDDDDEDSRLCLPCRAFFGVGHMGGCTNYSPEQTLERLKKAKEDQWAMVLVDRTFSAPGGTNFTIEKGDFFKITRIGADDYVSELPSGDRSMKKASVDIAVGPIALTLFPHEYSPQSMTYILGLLADKEVEVKYICQEDEIGYYTLTPEVREIVRNMYG